MLIWPAVVALGLVAAIFLMRSPYEIEEIEEYEQQALARPAREAAQEQAAAESAALTPEELDEQFGWGPIGRLSVEFNHGGGERALEGRGISFSGAIDAPEQVDFAEWWDYLPRHLRPLLERGRLYSSGRPSQTLDTCMAFEVDGVVLWFHCKEGWLARAGGLTAQQVGEEFTHLFVRHGGVADVSESNMPTRNQPFSQSVRIDGTRIRVCYEYHGTGTWKDTDYDISLMESRVSQLLADAAAVESPGS